MESTGIQFSKGSGGRSSNTAIVAAVFGSTGFLGRHVVHQLGRHGTQVVAAWRGDSKDGRDLKVMGDLGQIALMEMSIRDRESVVDVCKHANVIINLVGKHYDTWNFTVEQSTLESATVLSEVAKELGINHFVQMSMANASKDSESGQLRAKVEAEEIVRKNVPTSTIVKATDIFGLNDRFFYRIMQMFSWMIYYPLVNQGKDLVQPVHVVDVANAIGQVVNDYERFAGRTLNLAGPDVLTEMEVTEWAIDYIGGMYRFNPAFVSPRIARLLQLPFAKAILLVNQQPVLGKYDVAEGMRSNVLGTPAPDELTFDDLGIIPHKVDSVVGREALALWMSEKILRGSLVEKKD
ncbi:hypothetical protein NDN08_001221 [Rhodosorus marinus]|uniref:NmrA-like domain-containing protein n=1 Tax=Rhodosorus marinus TaxID=101924 RepID=A0AAV8UUD4_9RHOD|nr:hypothetical protein NDN08_001221 [Rhodosorus marinus]